MRKQIMMKNAMKTKKNCGAKAGLAASALCLLMLTGCGSDTVGEVQGFSYRETQQVQNEEVTISTHLMT